MFLASKDEKNKKAIELEEPTEEEIKVFEELIVGSPTRFHS